MTKSIHSLKGKRIIVELEPHIPYDVKDNGLRVKRDDEQNSKIGTVVAVAPDVDPDYTVGTKVLVQIEVLAGNLFDVKLDITKEKKEYYLIYEGSITGIVNVTANEQNAV